MGSGIVQAAIAEAPEIDVEPSILVVDDDPHWCIALCATLDDAGYQTTVAHSFDQSCAIVDEARFDLALIDFRLGSDNGIELISHFTARQPGLNCVLVTGHADMAIAMQAMHAGAFDFFSKPLEPEPVLADVRRCFEKIRLKREKLAAEQALDEAQRRLRSITDTLPGLICRFRMLPDGALRAEYVSPGIEALLGYRPDELVINSADLRKLIHPVDRQMITGMIAEAEPGCAAIHRRLRVLHKSGSVKWIRIAAAAEVDDPHGLWSAVALDVTGQVEAEEALQDSYRDLESRVAKRTAELAEANFRMRREISERQHAEEARQLTQSRLIDAIESLPAAFALYDADGRLVLWNRRAELIFPQLATGPGPGVSLDQLLRLDAESNSVSTVRGQQDERVQERLTQPADCPDLCETLLTDGRLLTIFERRTSDGGMVRIWLDINEISEPNRSH